MRHAIPFLTPAIVGFAPLASAQLKFPAVLEGHAILPAMTFVPAQADADGVVKKVGCIDMIDIDDPNQIARQGGKDGKFTLPFFTIENVDLIDADHMIVGNDSNLPFSSGRTNGKSDDNEMMILKVGELLRAK